MEGIFENSLSNKEFVCTIYEELLQFNNKKI